MKLEVCNAARVIPCRICVEVAGTISRSLTRFRSRRLRLEFSSRSLRSETICPGWSDVESPASEGVAAACGVFGYALFFMLGLQYVSASRGAVVITMNPALTLLLAAWLFKERLNAAIILGMLLAIGGALTAITQGQVLQFFAGGIKSGEVLLLGCVICWAAYTLIGRALLQGIDALTATTITAAIGAFSANSAPVRRGPSRISAT